MIAFPRLLRFDEGVCMPETRVSTSSLKLFLQVASVIVLVVWVAVMFFSLVAYWFDFTVSEILISTEFTVSCSGFALLCNTILTGRGGPVTKHSRLELVGFISALIVGVLVLFTGVYVTFFEISPNFFSCICLIIGTCLILLNTKQM